MKINQAVILAGGEGRRLRPFTLKNPKPLIPINGKPFLEYLINLLKDNGISEIVILTGYLGDKIQDYFGNGSKLGVRIKYSYTPFLDENGMENKSGIRIKNAEKLLDNYFLLLYCDNYWPLQIKRLINFFTNHPSEVLITAYSNLDNSTRNNILIKDGYVSGYDPDRKEKNLNAVDIGFFIVNKKVLQLLPQGNCKFENEILPKLIKKKALAGYLTDQKYYSIGDFQRVKTTEKFLSPKKIIFLDRDGVINKKPEKAEYVKNWEDFKFLPGSKEALKLLNEKGYQVFIISNQAGIARGAMTEKDLKDIHKNMKKELSLHGGKIKDIYYCPHGWDENCSCRKPKPGMLLQASQDHFIDLTKALFIGDDERDQQAGEAAGCKTILVNQKSLLKIVNSLT
jgi:D-glycero-D-manno-heptose 1,7-bisphosphate phosphatase